MFTWCEKQAASDRCDQTKEEVREYKNYMQEFGIHYTEINQVWGQKVIFSSF